MIYNPYLYKRLCSYPTYSSTCGLSYSDMSIYTPKIKIPDPPKDKTSIVINLEKVNISIKIGKEIKLL